MTYTVALFGEAEKGDYRTAYFCQNLSQLADNLGHPPPDSLGLQMAIQALMFRRNLIFFRVEEEGFSLQDYLIGLRFLENNHYVSSLAALCLPGVGDEVIFQASEPVLDIHNSLLITTEADLYDLMTRL